MEHCKRTQTGTPAIRSEAKVNHESRPPGLAGTSRHQDTMTLQPRQPPGRASRRARAYTNDIARLHAQGYSLEAIRQALAEAGVAVSCSTVRRELLRGPLPAPLSAAPPAAPSTSTPTPPSWAARAALPAPPPTHPPEGGRPVHVDATASPTLTTDRPTGGTQASRAFAAEFMKGRITNPLFRKRS